VSQIAVDKTLCKKDGACVAVCPGNTLALDENEFPEEVAEGTCIFCGHCVAVCSCNALTHAGLPMEEFLPVSKDLPSAAVIDGFLMGRRSVREFKDRPVSKETLHALLDVARHAPSASNSQKLHWIVMGEKAEVRTLSEETMNWLRATGLRPHMLEQWEKGNDVVLRGAPALIMVCAPADYGWGKQDSAIALTFLELAAEARGLGVCWAGFLTHVASVHAPVREALLVPEGYVVHGGLMLGEGKYSYRLVPPRKPLSVRWL
jgi:nitroreductase/NAD-dependent dihydropyrimidine dehydrogenase PreA subunit